MRLGIDNFPRFSCEKVRSAIFTFSTSCAVRLMFHFDFVVLFMFYFAICEFANVDEFGFRLRTGERVS